MTTGTGTTVASLERQLAHLVEAIVTARGDAGTAGPVRVRCDWQECDGDGAVCDRSAVWRVDVGPAR